VKADPDMDPAWQVAIMNHFKRAAEAGVAIR
jgi:hypothetical protein